MVWYAFAGVAIILSGYLFLFGSDADNGHQHAVGMFIGLWAPMFGILGLRAEMAEMREELTRRRGRG
nr:Na+/H+ antiporter subunit [uncultured bacterium]